MDMKKSWIKDDGNFWVKMTPEKLQEHLNKDEKADAKDERGNTLLHCAAIHNKNPEVIAVLLRAGADVNAQNHLNETPLHMAVSWNCIEVITALLDSNADVNAWAGVGSSEGHGIAPIHSAAEFRKYPEIIKALADKGADLNVCNWVGQTPLHLATQNHINPEGAMIALLNAGVEVSIKNKEGKTPYELALTNPKLKGTVVLNMLEPAKVSMYGE